MSAWVKQLKSQIEKRGAAKASWYCEWDEPDGTRRTKSCGPGPKGKRNAERLAEKTKAELLTGTYQCREQRSWSTFRKAYEDRRFPQLGTGTRAAIAWSLNHLERIVNPKNVSCITTRHIEDFVAKRRKDRGVKPGSKVSPATINKDLRHIRAVLNVAHEWDCLPKVPRFQFVKEPQKLPTYVAPEHFAAIYEACDAATSPADLQFTAATWWRGLLTMALMTGWRLGEILALKWNDVDLEAATAVTQHADNKGSRDEKVALHSVVVEHLQAVRSFDEFVFPWEHSRRKLYIEFARTQDAAGIDIPCPDASDSNHGCCTDACHQYGFHDERRAFATLNAEHMSREALQALMRHKSASTTDRYINHARQLSPAVANLHVPDVLKTATVG